MKQLICVLLFFVLLFPYMAFWDVLKQAPIAAIGRAVQSYFQPQQQQTQSSSNLSSQGFKSGFDNGSVGGNSSSGGGGGGSLVKNAQGQLVPAPSSGGGGGGGGGSSWNNGGGGDTELQMLEKMGDRNPIQERRYQELKGYQAPRPAPQAPPAPPKPQTFDMGAYQRKLQSMASSAGQKASSVLGMAGNAVTSSLGAIKRSIQPLPSSKVYAGEGNEQAPENWKTKLGKGLENLGTMFGAPELKWSESLAGGATPLTGQTESSAKVFSPYRYTPEERVGATSEKTGLGFTPGEAQNLVGTQTLGRTPPNLGGGGAGSVLGLSDVTFASLVDEIMSPTSFAQFAQMPMEDLDAAYTRMADELGVTKQQAVLNDINTQVLQVADLLDSIDKDVTEEAGNVLMTEGQRRRLVESRARPLREQMTKLMRSAQYAGVGLENLMGMLKDRMGAKQQTVTNQFQASQQAQSAEEERKRRLMGLLPYVQPKAKAVSSGGGGGGGGGSSNVLGGMSAEEFLSQP